MIQDEQRKKIFDALELSEESHMCGNCSGNFDRNDEFGVQCPGAFPMIYIVCSVCGTIAWISAEALGLTKENL